MAEKKTWFELARITVTVFQKGWRGSIEYLDDGGLPLRADEEHGYEYTDPTDYECDEIVTTDDLFQADFDFIREGIGEGYLEYQLQEMGVDYILEKPEAERLEADVRAVYAGLKDFDHVNDLGFSVIGLWKLTYDPSQDDAMAGGDDGVTWEYVRLVKLDDLLSALPEVKAIHE